MEICSYEFGWFPFEVGDENRPSMYLIDKGKKRKLERATEEKAQYSTEWMDFKKWWQYRPKPPYTYFIQKVENLEVKAMVFSEDLKKIYVTIKDCFPLEYIVVYLWILTFLSYLQDVAWRRHWRSQRRQGTDVEYCFEDVGIQRQRLNTKLEFLDAMLQRVKEEERLPLASGLPAHSSGNLLKKEMQRIRIGRAGTSLRWNSEILFLICCHDLLTRDGSSKNRMGQIYDTYGSNQNFLFHEKLFRTSQAPVSRWGYEEL